MWLLGPLPGLLLLLPETVQDVRGVPGQPRQTVLWPQVGPESDWSLNVKIKINKKHSLKFSYNIV